MEYNPLGTISSKPANLVLSNHGENGEIILYENPNKEFSTFIRMPSDILPFTFPFYDFLIDNKDIVVLGNSGIRLKKFQIYDTDPLGVKIDNGDAGIWLHNSTKNVQYSSVKVYQDYMIVRYEGLNATNHMNIWETTFFTDGTIQVVTGGDFGYVGKTVITNGTKGEEWDFGKGLVSNKSHLFVPSSDFSTYTFMIGSSYELPTELPTPPKPTIISNSKDKISKNTGVDRTNLKFKFDKKVTQWTVNVGGTSPTTGFIADSGGTTEANTELTAIIDGTELQSEGVNKVNIYGKDESGNWTPYEAE